MASSRLSGARKRYARKIRRKAQLRSRLLVQAFAEVERERYLGPGPWWLRGGVQSLRRLGYWRTRDDHPRHLYNDVLVGIFPERGLNNGLPSALALWFENLDLKRGERVVHIGCGTGYYSAILAHVVGPAGHVTAVEINDELAERARQNLAHLRHVEVLHADGSNFDLSAADVVFVNAGATHPPRPWLETLRSGARFMFPMITTHEVSMTTFRRVGSQNQNQVRANPVWARMRMAGVMLLVARRRSTYTVAPVSGVGMFPCIGAVERDADARVARALEGGGYESVSSLRRSDHPADNTCWLHGTDFCFSTLPASDESAESPKR